MTRPRTLSELAEEARRRSFFGEATAVSHDDLRRMVALNKQQIDAAYEQMSQSLANSFYAPPPEGWTPPKPTRRQRATAFAWRLRGWLAVPFVWVLRWLYPSALDRGDQ